MRTKCGTAFRAMAVRNEAETNDILLFLCGTFSSLSMHLETRILETFPIKLTQKDQRRIYVCEMKSNNADISLQNIHVSLKFIPENEKPTYYLVLRILNYGI